jgi:Tfp pilus assembly protein PilO
MEKIMHKLNGNAPGITLLVLLISLIGTGAGWVYQLRANDVIDARQEVELDALKKEYLRKDVADAQYEALSKQLTQMYVDNKEDHRDIFEILRKHK